MLDSSVMLSSALDILLPRFCALCAGARASNIFCEACEDDLEGLRLKGPVCSICGAMFLSHEGPSRPCGECLSKRPAFERAISVFEYRGKLLDAIHAFKYGQKDWLGKALGAHLAHKVREDFSKEGLDVIVPVPLHRARLRERSFNQSLLLARTVAASLKLRLDYLSLKKIKETTSQAGLNRGAREDNVKGAFEVKDRAAFKDKGVLLVDDVYTTGATLKECSKALKKAGARVFVITLARTIKE